jgi:hypothetical protein
MNNPIPFYDGGYVNRAFDMVKNLDFFWEPLNAYGVSAQIENEKVLLTQLAFSVRPIFHETHLEIWPFGFRLKEITFYHPLPKILYIEHMNEMIYCVFLGKPKEDQEFIKVNTAMIGSHPLITIKGFQVEHMNQLRDRWQASQK